MIDRMMVEQYYSDSSHLNVIKKINQKFDDQNNRN